MSSAYAVPVDKDEHEGSPPDQMQQLVAIDEYIREFDHGDTVKATELFTPYVSCNLVLFGMREFGGGENYHSGIQNSRYFAWHVAMMAIYVPGMYVTLHCTGIRVWVAAAISAATFPPLMVVSMIAESKIFRSRFLAAKLLRRGEDVKALKTKGCKILVPFLAMMLLQIAVLFLLPYLLLVRPYTQLVPAEVFLEFTMLSVLILFALISPFMYSFSMWQPLVKFHYKETIWAVQKTVQAFDIVLFHPAPSLTPAEARKELGAITNKLLIPLEYELKIMSQEIFGVIACALPVMVGACYLLFGAFEDNMMGAAGDGFRITIGLFILFMVLSMPASVGNAGKVHGHWRRLNRKLNDAENVARAAAVFDGDFQAFMAWFRRNEISAKFCGWAIDDQLPGKIMALFASILGAVALVVARVSGWY